MDDRYRQHRGSQFNARRQPALHAHDIWAVTQDPMLRWQDVPGGDLLAGQLMLDPDDAVLGEVFQLTVQQQAAKAMVSGDPFYGNYPPAGVLPPLGRGRIPLCSLPIRDVMSQPVEGVCKNVLVVGPSGSGKTTWLRAAMAALLEDGQATIVAFDRKGDLVDCAMLTRAGLPLLVLLWSELMIAMLQHPPGMRLHAFLNTFIQLLASHLNLFASRRLMLETLQLLYKRQRHAGTSPTLAEWIELIESIRVNATSRLGQYREAALFALKSIHTELGGSVGFAASDFFERLFARPGCFVINTSGISVEAASLLASLFIFWAYESRGVVGVDCSRPLIFVLDDALPLVTGSVAAESEGGINPLSNWAFMGRSRKMGFVVSSQNFSLISPALKNNTDTLLCFSSYGRDAEELARYLHLTPEQAALLPVLQPGEVIAIARSVWPHAVYGRVPNLA